MPFNLLYASWIPVRAPSGEFRWIAPAEIAELGNELYDVEWGRPEFRIATLELLIGLFAVALAEHLEDSSDWARLLDNPLSGAELAAKLAPFERYFELDGKGPRFLQDFDALNGETRPPDALLIDAPGENTLKNGADIFSKRGRFPVFSRKTAAVALYAMQAFAPSGGAGHRTSMRGGGPLTTLVTPARPTLWRRIVANLPLMDAGEKLPPEDLSLVFPWMKPTRHSTGGTLTNPGKDAHALQCYFGMPRRIRLVLAPNSERIPCAITGEIDETVVTGFLTAPWGVSYGVWVHPLSPYYSVKGAAERLPVHAQSGRVGYRDWAAYLFGNETTYRAEQVLAFGRVFSQKDARLLATGFVTDNMKCLDWAESEAPLYLLPNPHARQRLALLAQERFVPAASIVALALRGALRDSLAVDDGQKTRIATAFEQFWMETDGRFFSLLDSAQERLRALGDAADEDQVLTLDFADLIAQWLAAMRRAALDIFQEHAPVERIGDLDEQTVKRIVVAAKNLRVLLLGYGKRGGELFRTLGLPPPVRPAA